MKKKVFIAVAVAAALAAMPVVAGAVVSPSYDNGSSDSGSSSSGGSSSKSYSSSSSASTGSTAGVASGATVVSSQPTVQVTESGAKVTVSGATKDATGTTMGLVGESAGNGAVSVGEATVSVATGVAETAGLPEAAVSTILALNNSSAVLSNTLPGLGLDGFAKVGGTRAIVSKNAAGADVAAPVSLYVDSLPVNGQVKVVCYNNVTGQWTVLNDVKVDPATKTVSFTVPASCTIQIAAK